VIWAERVTDKGVGKNSSRIFLVKPERWKRLERFRAVGRMGWVGGGGAGD